MIRFSLILLSLFSLMGELAMSAEHNATQQVKNLSYTRIYIDDEGNSHFSGEEIPMTLAGYAMPGPKVGLSTTYDASSLTFFSAPPGLFADWHIAIRKQFLFHLSGISEITVSDDEVRRFVRGDIVLVEDTTGQGHIARVIGEEDVVIAAVPAIVDE